MTQRPEDDASGLEQPHPVARRPDASMTLLREIMERPRDLAYEQAQTSNRGQGSWWQQVVVLLLTIAIGTGGVWAARQLRAPVESALEARAVLEDQIRERSTLTDTLRTDISELRHQIGDLEGQISSPLDETLTRDAQVAGVRAGTVAVSGPGVEVTLTNPDEARDPQDQVLDVDLQIVTNALWASGAEAISINGRRLAYGTAIRTAGEVILVDLEPVQSPYVVSAIGDPDILVRAFAETTGAEHVKYLNSQYRIKSSITQLPQIKMNAGNALRFSYAQHVLEVGLHGTLREEGDSQ